MDAPHVPLRLLFLTPFRPRVEGQHGGARVTGQLIAGLARRHEVAVVHFDDPPPVHDDLDRLCARMEPVPLPAIIRGGERVAVKLRLLRGFPTRASELHNPDFGRRVAEVAPAWRPDVVQVEYPVLGQYLAALDGCRAPTVLVDHDAALRESRTWGGPAPAVTAALDERAWRRYKRRTLDRVDAAVAFTARDAQLLAELHSPTPIHRIPFGAPVPAEPMPAAAGQGVLFVGNFNHPPNVDAALRLAREVFLPLRATHPDARLTLVGPSPPRELLALAGDGVVVTGEVPDVASHLREAAVVATPIRRGSGMRVKVVEALAAGKAVVATPLAVEGLDVRAGEQLELAESDAGLREAMARLLDDPEGRAALGARAHAWARANLSWDAVVAAYERLYASLLDGSRTRRASA